MKYSLVAMLALAGTIAACSDSTSPSAPGYATCTLQTGTQAGVSVRFVNAAPRYGTVKLCVNSVELGRGTFSPDVASLATPLSSISQKMVVTATNDSTVLAYTPVTFAGDTSYTVVFTQHSSKGGLLVLHDTVSTPPAGQVVFRFVNVAPSASAVDVYKTTGSANLTGVTPWVSNVSFEKSSSYVSVPAGSYRIIVTAMGHPESVLYDSKTASPVTGGQAWTVLLMDNCGCGGFENTTPPLMMTSVKDRG